MVNRCEVTQCHDGWQRHGCFEVSLKPLRRPQPAKSTFGARSRRAPYPRGRPTMAHTRSTRTTCSVSSKRGSRTPGRRLRSRSPRRSPAALQEPMKRPNRRRPGRSSSPLKPFRPSCETCCDRLAKAPRTAKTSGRANAKSTRATRVNPLHAWRLTSMTGRQRPASSPIPGRRPWTRSRRQSHRTSRGGAVSSLEGKGNESRALPYGDLRPRRLCGPAGGGARAEPE